jgi:peptidyl-prolyl cis-trans isomerase SurA
MMLSRFFIIISALLFLSTGGGALADQVINRVVAVVGDDVITAIDLDKSISRTKVQMARMKASGQGQDIPPGQLRRLSLERLIDDKIFEKEVKRQKLSVSKGELDHYIDRIMRANKIGEDDFVASLSRQGLTPEEYRANLRREILKQKLINQAVKKQIVVTDSEVDDYFKEHREQFKNIAEVKFRAIFLTVDPKAGLNTGNVVRQKGENLLQKIKEGADFGELAKQYSQGPGAAQGGLLGPLKAADLLPSMRQALAELKPGAVSPVMQIPQGFVIMKLVDRAGGGDLPLDAVREQIRKKLEAQNTEKRFREWMKELREETYVKIID